MSGFIPEEIINRVRDSIDIVDLVSRYLALKKAGSSYKALCPFHKEKTASFNVSPARQIFKCFGCGKGGNVFHFVMAMDRVSFPEAVRMLAREAHVEIPETRPSPEKTAARDERTSLYNANRRAADFFARMLAGSLGEAAQEYISGRGITQETVERCSLGYSPDSWDALLTAAGAAGVSAGLLCQAGLALKRQDGSGYYDRFRNRLMFPIFDTQDRVVGFGARTMGDEDVKYLNSPETPVFSKGRSLYGLNWARKSIVDSKRVAVVEGYTDVIMAQQNGVENVVATLGTALTREHIRVLRRFAERVDVVFDSDTAGQQAAERSMELFLDEGAGEFVAAGFDVRIATMPEGKDPCDLLVEQGAGAFVETVDAAVDVFTRKIQIASRRHDITTVEGKTKAVDEVLALVALVPNAIGRQLRIDAVARLLADTFGVDVGAVRDRLGQMERRRRRRAPAEERTAEPAAPHDPVERIVIEALLALPDVADGIFAELTPEDFGGERLRQLFEAMRRLHEADGTVNALRLLAGLADADLAALVSGAIEAPPRPGLADTAADGVRTLLKRRAGRRMREVKKELASAKASGDEKLADDLSTEWLKLQRVVDPTPLEGRS